MYRALRWVMFRVPPERIHTWVFALLRVATGPSVSRRLLAKWLAPSDPVLETTVFGVTFPGPVGLAAGFDKNGSGINAWGPLGFGYAEVGTVTAQAQPGNPAPRLFRLPEDRALLTDPQTSGGLLVSCTPAAVNEVMAVFLRHGFEAAAVVEPGKADIDHGHGLSSPARRRRTHRAAWPCR